MSDLPQVIPVQISVVCSCPNNLVGRVGRILFMLAEACGLEVRVNRVTHGDFPIPEDVSVDAMVAEALVKRSATDARRLRLEE